MLLLQDAPKLLSPNPEQFDPPYDPMRMQGVVVWTQTCCSIRSTVGQWVSRPPMTPEFVPVLLLGYVSSVPLNPPQPVPLNPA